MAVGKLGSTTGYNTTVTNATKFEGVSNYNVPSTNITGQDALKKSSTLKPKNNGNNSSTNIGDDAPSVFGSFGLKYPVTGIETEREDGVTVINYSPECRVFICGGEVTKDIASVTVNYTSDNMSSATIKLANPRGKYNIHPSDLVSNKGSSGWREDKSIQATYEYDWLKKQVPGFWGKKSRDDQNKKEENKVTKVGNALLGKQVTATYNSVVNGIKNMSKNRQKGFTQMLYEVKHHSNMTKAVGETVFDYRDTVYIFFKGRFSTYWYFGFSGIVAAIDKSFVYGSTESITLQCHDIIGILKRKKFTQQGAILPAANLEAANNLTTQSRIFNLFDDVPGNFSLVVKTIMFVSDENYVKSVENSHFYYTPKCTLNQGVVSPNDQNSHTKGKTPPAENKALEPYGDNKTAYLNNFCNVHKFNRSHYDDEQRNNVGKKFREFKLIDDTPRNKNEKIIKNIELTNIKFRPGYVVYLEEQVSTSKRRDSINSKSTAQPPEGVKAALRQYIDQIADIANNSNTKVSWTLLGHNAWIVDFPLSIKSSLSAEDRASLSKYSHIDLGDKYTDYKGFYSSKYKGLYVSPGTTFRGVDYIEGAGAAVSEERAKRVLRDLKNIIKELTSDSANQGKYDKVASIINNITVKGVGKTEPRDLSNKKIEKSEFSSVQDILAYDNVIFSTNGADPVNVNNRFIELVPSTNKYEVKPEDIKEDGDSLAFFKDPHKLRFSPLTDIYFQLNEININDYTPENLDVFYDSSARYWLKGPGSKLDMSNLGSPDKTGWKHTHGFGVCGIHPALTYDFIDNFSILPDVHATIALGDNLLDSATLTPLDLLREQVYGVGTELTNSLSSDSKNIGTQHNYFRPRIFLVVPKKFREREKNNYKFSSFDLVKIQALNTWDMLNNLIVQYEYTIYTSPMGDLFIEPLMHDFHPLDFFEKIEDRAICPREYNKATRRWEYKGVDIYFRTTINTYDNPVIAYRKDKAYKFNFKANHPFFITNKDLKRITETLKPENLMSHVILNGSVAGQAGLTGGAIDTPITGSAIPYIDIESEVQKISENNKLRLTDKYAGDSARFDSRIGIYVANGFQLMQRPNLKAGSLVNEKLKKEVEQYKQTYAYKLYNDFMTYKQESTIGVLIAKAAEGIQKLKDGSIPIYNKNINSLVERYIQNAAYHDDAIDLAVFDDGSLTPSQLTTLYNIAPRLYELYYYVYLEQKKQSSTTNVTVVKDKPYLVSYFNITTLNGPNGLLKLLVSKLTKGDQNIDVQNIKSKDEQIDIVVNSFINNEDLKYNNSTIEIIKDLMSLHEVFFLSDTAENSISFREVNNDLFLTNKKLEDFTGLTGFVTKGDLKKYEMLQLYDPSKDYVTKYGWNPGPTITNTYFNNGAEAEIYCKVLFDKINSKMYELNCDIIGRPELFLNRPYYVEQDNVIGSLNNYSISYTPGGVFSSNVILSYIRRNSISYGYSLGNLDKVVSLKDGSIDSHSNVFFNDKAVNYFKSIFASDKSDNRFGAVNDVLSRSINAGPVGAIVGGAAQAFMKKRKQQKKNQSLVEPDGLYVAHDWIGHTDWDVKYGIVNTELFTGKPDVAKSDEPKYIAKLGGFVITRPQAQDIVNKNKSLHTAFLLLEQIEKDYEINNINIQKITTILMDLYTQLDDYTTRLANNSLSPILRSSYNKQYKLLEEQIIHNNTYNKAELSRKKQLDDSYKKLSYKIYGEEGTYNPVSTDKDTEVKYKPSSTNRKCTYKKDNETSLMFLLYKSIPEKDVYGSSIKQYCTLIDDTQLPTSNVSENDDNVPLYINVMTTNLDNSTKA